MSKVVVITGATAGVGRATVHAFAKQKAYLAIIARDTERLEEVRREAEALGATVLTFSIDIANAKDIEEAADRIVREFGAIDVWVNNAMVSVFSRAIEMTPDEYKRVTEVSYLGYVYGTLSALKHMLKKDKGVIIQVGSALAYRGIPLQSAYCGAKHAIEGFTESIRCELMHDRSNVRISMIQLPAINTPQFNWVKSRLPRKPRPVPPIYQPEVAAEAIVWASEHYRREWYLGSSTVVAILVNKIAPGLADLYLAFKGFESQQYDGSDDPNRPHNLFEPVKGAFGAHGDFDALATSTSYQFWFSKYRIWFILLFILVIVLFIFR